MQDNESSPNLAQNYKPHHRFTDQVRWWGAMPDNRERERERQTQETSTILVQMSSSRDIRKWSNVCVPLTFIGIFWFTTDGHGTKKWASEKEDSFWKLSFSGSTFNIFVSCEIETKQSKKDHFRNLSCKHGVVFHIVSIHDMISAACDTEALQLPSCCGRCWMGLCGARGRQRTVSGAWTSMCLVRKCGLLGCRFTGRAR